MVLPMSLVMLIYTVDAAMSRCVKEAISSFKNGPLLHFNTDSLILKTLKYSKSNCESGAHEYLSVIPLQEFMRPCGHIIAPPLSFGIAMMTESFSIL